MMTHQADVDVDVDVGTDALLQYMKQSNKTFIMFNCVDDWCFRILDYSSEYD